MAGPPKQMRNYYGHATNNRWAIQCFVTCVFGLCRSENENHGCAYPCSNQLAEEIGTILRGHKALSSPLAWGRNLNDRRTPDRHIRLATTTGKDRGRGKDGRRSGTPWNAGRRSKPANTNFKQQKKSYEHASVLSRPKVLLRQVGQCKNIYTDSHCYPPSPKNILA